MAVVIKGYIYEGLSSDAKPTTNVPTNTRFLETDTVLEYIWDGTNWKPIDDPRLEFTEHPFGKGSLLVGGAQYCTPVTGVTNAAYVAVETKTITQPLGFTLVEVEFGLTAATGSSGTTDATLFKWQASDNGADWQDLCAEQTAALATAYVDATLSGRFAPTGNFLGAGTTFQVRFVIKSAGATDTANGKTKNSSYVICRYRR